MYKTILLSLCFSLIYCLGLAQTPEWQHIPGPEGGQVSNFDLDSNRLYALTGYGIFYSYDEGYHWELVPLSTINSSDKHQLKVEKGIFYALNDNGALVCSTDQSATWKPLLQRPFPINTPEEFLQRYFVKGDTILVGSHFTIYRSTDKGQTWTNTADFYSARFSDIFEFKNELFAAQTNSIYRSSDAGATWAKVFSAVNGLATVMALDSTIYIFSGDTIKLMRSTDGLRSLDSVETGIIAQKVFEDYWINWAGGHQNQLYFIQSKGNFFACPITFSYSNDGGNTWLPGNQGEPLKSGGLLFDCVFFDNHLVLASDQILHSTDQGTTFTDFQKGLNAAYVYKIFRHEDKVILNDNYYLNHLSTDHGQTWSNYPASPLWAENCYDNQSIEATNENFFQLQGLPPKVFYSNKAEENWKPLDFSTYAAWATTDHAFWVSETDWGAGTFTSRFWKFADGDTALRPIELLDFHPPNPIDGLRGLGDRLCAFSQEDFYIFDEQGILLQKLPESSCFNAGDLHFDGSTYFNFCGIKTEILPPGATKWQEIYPQDWTTGTPFYHFQRNFIHTYDGITWVGLSGKGLFYSTNHSGRFYPVEPQMPFPYPTALSIDDEELWVGTAGGGIWTLPTPKTLKGPLERDNFKLFPNPSSGALNLESSTFITTEITLSIFDTAGKRVAQKELKPGLSWDLNFPNLAKGLYFLQLRTASSVVGLKWVVDH